MRTLGHSFSLALLVVALSAPELKAQGQTQQPSTQQPQQPQNQAAQPIPAYRSPLAKAADNSAAQDTGAADNQQMVPDTSPPAGALGLSLGAPKTARSYWRPFVDLSASAFSNSGNGGSSTGWTTWTSVSGGLDLHKISGNSSLTMALLSGGSFSNSGSGTAISSTVSEQVLGLTERISFHRTAISLMDQVGYLPQASFGYNGLGTPGSDVGGNLGLQAGLTPNQSILTTAGQRISNTSLVEIDTNLTPRKVLTLVGSYGLLHYFGSSLSDNNETVAQVGYNYQLNRKDTIAVLYRFDAFRFSHVAQSINDHSVQLSYARRIAGRLSFQLSAGPDFAFSQTPISPQSAPIIVIGKGGNTTQFFWDVNAGLIYQLRRTALNLGYMHGVTGGSGVLAGAVTDGVSGSASRQLSQRVNAGWTIGYSRNTGLAVTSATTLATANQTYDYWYSGVNFTRNFGRSMNLTLGYQVQYQNSNTSFCVSSQTCKTTYLNHQIFLDLGWHPRSFNSSN
jgi:hypothetical protein